MTEGRGRKSEDGRQRTKRISNIVQGILNDEGLYVRSRADDGGQETDKE